VTHGGDRRSPAGRRRTWDVPTSCGRPGFGPATRVSMGQRRATGAVRLPPNRSLQAHDGMVPARDNERAFHVSDLAEALDTFKKIPSSRRPERERRRRSSRSRTPSRKPGARCLCSSRWENGARGTGPCCNRSFSGPPSRACGNSISCCSSLA